MDSNLTDIGYVEETTFGTTPSAALQIIRRTGGSLRPTQTEVESQEIRSDLRPGPPIRTHLAGGGEVPIEWSYGTWDDLLEGMFMNSWSTDQLTDGTTKKSYTFEEQFVDPAISPSQYITYKGSRIRSMTMNLALDAPVRGSFGIMAATPAIAQASAGTGNTAPTTTEPFNCVGMVSILREQSASLGRVMGVNLRFERNLRNKRQLGSLNPFDIGVGRLIISGQVTQYFEDDTLMDAYLAFGERSLEIQLTDDPGNDLLIHLPRIKYVGDPSIDNPGADSDRLVRLNFRAFADEDDAFLAQLTRSAA